MYICVCNAVTERHIERAVAQGARRMRDLRVSLGVTSECARCADCARQCLNSALGKNDAGRWPDAVVQPLASVPTLEMEAP